MLLPTVSLYAWLWEISHLSQFRSAPAKPNFLSLETNPIFPATFLDWMIWKRAEKVPRNVLRTRAALNFRPKWPTYTSYLRWKWKDVSSVKRFGKFSESELSLPVTGNKIKRLNFRTFLCWFNTECHLRKRRSYYSFFMCNRKLLSRNNWLLSSNNVLSAFFYVWILI